MGFVFKTNISNKTFKIYTSNLGRSQSWRDEEAAMGHNNSENRSFNTSTTPDRGPAGPGGKSLMAGTATRKTHTWNDEEKLPEW